MKRLDQRHAEAFVLACAQEQVCGVIEGGQRFVGDLAQDVDVLHTEVSDEPVQLRQCFPTLP